MKKIFVTGITGQQGHAVAVALKDKGFEVTGLTRSQEGDKAEKLKAEGFKLAVGDFKDKQSLVSALDGFDLAFFYTTPFEEGENAETNQGKTFIDAAKEAGVSHVIYNSVSDADKNTGVPHFDSKYRVEEHLKQSGSQFTIVAPVFFMDNIFFPDTWKGVKEGVYAVALPENLKLQQIAVEDIGSFVAYVADNIDGFVGKRIDIAGDELTAAETVDILSNVLGKEVTFSEVPLEAVRSFSEDLALMNEWFISTGYSADIENLRTTYPDVNWHSFEDWAGKSLAKYN